MSNKKHINLLSAFFIVYTILQSVFVFCWSVFVGFAGIALFIMSGMAHHPVDRAKIESEVQFIFIGIAILVIFAIVSGRIIFRTGKEISRTFEIDRKATVKAIILSVIGSLLNLTAFAITAWRLEQK